ncbi:MFS transporter, partial [Brevundimonas sp.]|uniref:MFS transporter n=1 Tax=Brevundimonas sp. TaxID=1871086 RepID=UPI0035B26A76
IAGITLGLVGQTRLAGRIGRNQAWNHGGNVVGAALGGLLGFQFGIAAIVGLTVLFALLSMIFAQVIRGEEIDHAQARGSDEHTADGPSGWTTLVSSRPLMIFAVVIFLFHLGNAAMLPLLSQAATSRQLVNPELFAALTIIIAQLTMIGMALLAARLAESRGYWIVLLLALGVLPVRGLIAGFWDDPWAIVPVQVLDGVGAGLIGVATPGLIARILAGTGHINAGYGAVETGHRIGAALSATLAGLVAARLGYGEAFLALAGVAVLALIIWLVATPLMRDACATRRASEQPREA